MEKQIMLIILLLVVLLVVVLLQTVTGRHSNVPSYIQLR